ncbi:unnamed protein product [Linum tenue]|uniref:Uncharacterized protein n=1 Tax=Linum tenue TaxID=586396 RepID=A0AAV0GTP1_9ROSI|nr:unnamed protein product [Linum tenue]
MEQPVGGSTRSAASAGRTTSKSRASKGSG